MQTARLSLQDEKFLSDAASYLERPGLMIRMANLVGKPAEGLLHVLPKRAQSLVGEVTTSALEKASDFVVRTLPEGDLPSARRWPRPAGERFHTAMAATTGAVGGLFGLPGSLIEIPATTVVMLRSIAEIAGRSGCSMQDPAVRLQCLAVFSFGSPSLEAMESAYLSSRLGVAMALQDAARYVAQRGALGLGAGASHSLAPVFVRLIHQIASRFQIVVSQKLAAQAVPIAGAAMGSLINAAFTDHFCRVAHFHFGIVRLEREFGSELVQAFYKQAVAQAAQSAA